MASVAVTILADTPAKFAEMVDRVKPFVKRLHIDIADGIFAPTKTIGLAQAYGLDGVPMDLHMMVDFPESQLENIIALNPGMVILHFESQGNIRKVFEELKSVGIKVGLAIKQDTTVEQVKSLLLNLDHLLIFTGNLGYNGGEMALDCLDKIAAAKAINPSLEVGVDGGVNQSTARLAIEAGADVLYTGSFVHDAADAEAAYIGLQAIAEGQV